MTENQTWTHWLSKYGTQLVLYARQFTGCHASAEDVVQEGFLKFWNSGWRNTEEPTGLLFRFVRNVAIDRLRSDKARLKRESDFQEEVIEAEALFEEAGEDDGAFKQAAQKAIKKLPQDQREILVMKIWGELTFAQISKILNISINTAGARYRYAIEKMERMLKDEQF